MTLNPEQFAAEAEAIARAAHTGQVDKIGVNYIEHPRRVAARFNPTTQPDETAVAWLHDVIEDTPVTAAELLEAGFPDHVVAAVELLTKNSAEHTLDAYYARIRENPLALAVKTADIADNTDPARTAQLSSDARERLAAKYAKARKQLGIATER